MIVFYLGLLNGNRYPGNRERNRFVFSNSGTRIIKNDTIFETYNQINCWNLVPSLCCSFVYFRIRSEYLISNKMTDTTQMTLPELQKSYEVCPQDGDTLGQTWAGE